MSTTTTVTRLQPPANDPPIATAGGQHSQAWADYFQNSADQLATLPARIRKGVTDGSEATAGDIGEFMGTTGSGVALSTGVVTSVVSLNLTPGDWDVSGEVTFAASTGTHSFFGAGVGGLDTFSSATFPTVAINMAISTATWRRNVTTTTSVSVVAEAIFTGTVTATGTIHARRMR